jgi:co-chaperonin GroES (HSP10)
MEPICPEGSNVLVEIEELKEQTEGGIWIPEIASDNYRQLCTTGNLIALGPATSLAYMRGGDRVEVTPEMLPLKVSFARYGGTPMHIGPRRGGRQFRLLTERDVTAFLFDENIEIPREV